MKRRACTQYYTKGERRKVYNFQIVLNHGAGTIFKYKRNITSNRRRSIQGNIWCMCVCVAQLWKGEKKKVNDGVEWGKKIVLLKKHFELYRKGRVVHKSKRVEKALVKADRNPCGWTRKKRRVKVWKWKKKKSIKRGEKKNPWRHKHKLGHLGVIPEMCTQARA